MNEQERANIGASDFVTLLYQKGYRRDFTLQNQALRDHGFTNRLDSCLKKFLEIYKSDNNNKKFSLKTTPPHKDNLKCNIEVDFDTVKGFLVREMTINDVISNQSKYYQFVNNNQLPGANAIQGLFPLPRPLDNHLKGRAIYQIRIKRN